MDRLRASQYNAPLAGRHRASPEAERELEYGDGAGSRYRCHGGTAHIGADCVWG